MSINSFHLWSDNFIIQTALKFLNVSPFMQFCILHLYMCWLWLIVTVMCISLIKCI